MLPQAKVPRSSRLSSTSTRREDSLGTEQHSPAAENGDSQQNKPDSPQLDWSKFKATFTIKHHAIPKTLQTSGKKRKRGPPARQPLVEENEFDKSLSTLYTVEPTKWWEDTRRYRKFTIANETFRLGDTVFVKPDDSEAVDAPLPNWVAKVLEVRAASEAHVFLRVFWMYRPEDIPGGRRPYHGRNEVIASNTMQVIDALTVNGKASVRHWTEDDNDEILDGDQLFWRQTFDCPSGTGTGVLSSLRKHCIDEAPFNPDTLLVHCDSCGLWLHGECLEHEAIRQVHAENNLPEPILIPASQKSAAMSQIEANGNASALHISEVKKELDKAEPAFTAEIKTGADEKSRIILEDTREGHEGERMEKKVHCLKCSALIE
ncbi:hypothetical protein B0J12DRAFT_585311 [Macrophomina phaseolina]|nr:hypothetical protein B0J12DRAFT_585311 [Macrophomina phaseolina]